MLRFILLLTICDLHLKSVSTLNDTTWIEAAILMTMGSELSYDYYNIGPALELAFDDSFTTYNVGYKKWMGLYEGGCRVSQAIGRAVDAINHSVDVFIGPACTNDMVAVSELLTYNKFPLMTGAGSLVDSTDAYPYTTRTSYNTYSQWLFFVMMCRRFNWTNVAVTYDKEDITNLTNALSLIKHLRDKNFKAIDIPFKGTDFLGFTSAKAVLLECSAQARVVVLLSSSTRVRQLVIQAQRMGMGDGDYAFFALDLFQTEYVGGGKNTGWRLNDMFDQEAEIAYRSTLFILSLKNNRSNPQFKAFERRVQERAKTPIYGRPLDVNYFSVTFYDAVMMFSQIVNETVSEGKSIGTSNVAYYTQKLTNRTFKGAAGTIYMNPSGDRDDDYQILQMTETSRGEFIPVAEFYGARGIYEEVTPVEWSNDDGTPTVNRPPCGYDGNDPVCVAAARTALGAALGGVFCLLIFCSLFGFLIYRHVSNIRELNNLDWVIGWEEVFVHQRSQSKNSKGSLSTAGGSQKDHSGVQMPIQVFQAHQAAVTKSATTLGTKQSVMTKETIMRGSTIVATVRGNMVILRPCEGAHVELNNQVRNEVRIVKATMSCENLMKFMGACIDVGNVVVFGEYCSRGTLQDVLHNDAVTLDWVFRLSFISDIVRALMFIQSTLLLCHGRLTSKACFVDKRFVLKVTDYGLPSFYKTDKAPEQTELLWTAPEVLRSKNDYKKFTQEADAYAFAIILQEIILRESPFFMNNISPEDAVRRVERCERPPYRPTVDDPFCHQEILFVMRSCWAESPGERLKLPQVRNALRLLSK